LQVFSARRLFRFSLAVEIELRQTAHRK
jgi:hypothetical protein